LTGPVFVCGICARANVYFRVSRANFWWPNFAGGDAQAHAIFLAGTEVFMRLLIAFFLPWLTFFTIGRPVAGLICLLLQITLIGWIPATIWAVYALSQFKTDRKIARAMGQRP
jgi:uncharacterized membrane protein YqaE (UPF0057 family)